MSRRLAPSHRPITRAAAQHDRRPGTPATRSFVDGGIAVVHAAIDRLADDITNECIGALETVLEHTGLQSDMGNEQALRTACRNYVIDSVLGRLRDRVNETESTSELVANLRVSASRETLIEFLLEYERHD
jgi:hypothetical protein